MELHAKPITNAEEVKELCNRLVSHKIIAFDTEFIRESTFFPVLEIIQIATADEAWLIDYQAFRKKKNDLQPLVDILKNPAILKVLHAAQADQECLITSMEFLATPTLDTAVAASLCGYGDGIGLGNLLSAVLQVKLKKGHARTNWSTRPLPEQQVEYALSDVSYLVELGQSLLDSLEKKGRKEWALELSSHSEDPAEYEQSPDSFAEKAVSSRRLDQQSYPIYLKLIAWREDRAKTMNLPRKWVADDGVLLDLARVRPKDKAHLASFRGFNKGILRDGSEALLKIIRETEPQEPPRAKSIRPPSVNESRTIDLLRCYVGLLADQMEISSRHLVGGNEYIRLIRAADQGKDFWVQEKMLSAGAATLVGKELEEFLMGKKGLGLAGTGGRNVRVFDR